MVLFLGISHAVLAINKTELCEILPEDTVFRHATQCDVYYVCRNSSAIDGKCMPGLYFDIELGKCNDKSKVQCKADANSICSKKKNSHYIADPLNCENYYICVAGEGKLMSCPSGINFNPNTSSCDYTSEYECVLQKEDYDICESIPKKTLFKHPTKANQYRLCSGKKIIERSCLGGLFYNSKTGNCDTEEHVKDKDTIVGQPSGPETEGICGSKSKPYKGLVHDGKTCRGYFDCNEMKNSTEEKLTTHYCKTTEIFDEKLKLCKPRHETKCRFDRCEGQGDKYVNVQGDGCKGYVMCIEGKEFMKMSCPANHYFDENKQDCVTNVIKYPACTK